MISVVAVYRHEKDTQRLRTNYPELYEYLFATGFDTQPCGMDVRYAPDSERVWKSFTATSIHEAALNHMRQL